MRRPVWMLVFGLLLAHLAGGAGAREEKKRGRREQPIKVLKLERKTPVRYEKEVEPILKDRCMVCHSGSVTEGKLDLGSYETLVKGGKRGRPVVPGNSGQSLLVKLAGKVQRPFMPPRSEKPLTPEELALIKLWIDQGARAPAGRSKAPRIILKAPPARVTPVLGVAVSPDKSAVAASRGNQVHVYDANSGKHVRSLVDPKLVGPDKKPLKAAHLSLVESLAYSPDGKLLASGGYQEVILWDAHTGALRRRLTGFADRVVALGFSPDGKYLATGGGAPTQEGELKIFEAATGKLVRDIKKDVHSDTVFAVCFSPDGKVLASGGADKLVKAFDPAGGKLLKSFEGHTHHVLGVGWSGDGKLLASAGADNVVKVWDYAKGEQVRTIPAHGKPITCLQFVGKTPEFVTCSADRTIRFWRADNGGNTRNLGDTGDYVQAVAVSADGTVVAAGGQQGLVRLYKNNAPFKTLGPPGAAKAPKKK